MKKLLIGYDGSACADAALEELGSAGLPAAMEAHVLSVADVWLPSNAETPASPGSTPDVARKAREQAVRAVGAARELAGHGANRLRELQPRWSVTSEAVADSPGWALVQKAAHWHADLVLVGSHGRSMLERVFLGSVSQKVAVEAPCSVRVARPRRRGNSGPPRVVLTVDGSAESLGMVAAVATRDWPAGTEFHVVTVLDARLETSIGWPGALPPSWTPPAGADAAHFANHVLEAAAKQLFDSGLKVTTYLLRGDAKRESLAHADEWESDAIFVGARGLHHGQRLALGTTASAIISRAHCSVEIVRPG